MTTDEMQEYFPAVYPKMFVGKYGGVACGAGWFNILNQLCQNIQSHIDWKNSKEEVVAQVTIAQIKEKFGSLRFYYDGGDDYISGMVTLAESMSGVTCEDCGDVGVHRNGGWIRTLCDKHEAEYQARRKENE